MFSSTANGNENELLKQALPQAHGLQASSATGDAKRASSFSSILGYLLVLLIQLDVGMNKVYTLTLGIWLWIYWARITFTMQCGMHIMETALRMPAKSSATVRDLMLKNKKVQIKDIIRIVVDVAEGIKFMNDHGIAYRDLNA
ncbi:hypothetical protein K1719_034747 [Acacia pycnantha]|nr:hypothetical protein K1719_034747 [Acacia pycnantha]